MTAQQDEGKNVWSLLFCLESKLDMVFSGFIHEQFSQKILLQSFVLPGRRKIIWIY